MPFLRTRSWQKLGIGSIGITFRVQPSLRLSDNSYLTFSALSANLRENALVSVNQTVVIIPTYNEAENLRRLLPQLLELSLNILVVDDASSDGTAQVAKELGARTGRVEILERHGKLGLGSAYREGFAIALNSGFTEIIQMDADGSHRVVDLQKMLPYFTAHPELDVLIGSRWIDGGKVVHWPKHREMLSRCANFYSKVALGLDIHDSTAGFRIYRAQLLNRMPLNQIESEGYAFQIEMTRAAKRAGALITEFPITFIEREIGVSKMSPRIVREALFKVTKWGIARIFGKR
jgi:dolichol-phosphate mannosyltransferase